MKSFSVSMKSDKLDEFDKVLARRILSNKGKLSRNKAIEHLISKAIESPSLLDGPEFFGE